MCDFCVPAIAFQLSKMTMLNTAADPRTDFVLFLDQYGLLPILTVT